MAAQPGTPQLKPDEAGFRYVLMWMNHILSEPGDKSADVTYVTEWRDFVVATQSALREAEARAEEAERERARLRERIDFPALLERARKAEVAFDLERTRVVKAELRVATIERETRAACARIADGSKTNAGYYIAAAIRALAATDSEPQKEGKS